MDSVPFHFDSVHGGLSGCAGLLQLTADGFRCEYRVDVGGLGIKTAPKETSVRWDEILAVDFRRGWFGARAIFRPRSLKTLERFPSSGDDSVVFHFKRKDRALAEYLVSEIRLRHSQWRLDAPDGGTI